ncbi:hypothetical protein BH23ACT6_BH23ACT6_11280 [soil metagenome]
MPGYSSDGWYGRIFTAVVPGDKPIAKFTKKQLAEFLYGEPRKVKVDNINVTFEGLIPRIEKSMLAKDRDSMQPHIRAFVDRAITLSPCPECAGTRLSGTARSSKIDGLSIADANAMQISDLAAWVDDVDEPSVAPVLGKLPHTLDSFVAIGLDIPLAMLVVITGVAGSGKSSLIHSSAVGREGVITIDQSAIRGSRRSNPATYTGMLEPIRKAFAKANGVKPALFSANSESACPTCKGAGVIYTDLTMMAGVSSPCEECDGKRFSAAVSEYRFAGADISEVLAMPVARACDFFSSGEGGSLPCTQSCSAWSTSAWGIWVWDSH